MREASWCGEVWGKRMRGVGVDGVSGGGVRGVVKRDVKGLYDKVRRVAMRFVVGRSTGQ